MCSVVGYIGNKSSLPFVLEGLSRLEYRGYDSVGFACIDTDKISSIKVQGDISEFKKKCESFLCDSPLGLGHTRWSTHGVPSEKMLIRNLIANNTYL